MDSAYNGASRHLEPAPHNFSKYVIVQYSEAIVQNRTKTVIAG